MLLRQQSKVWLQLSMMHMKKSMHISKQHSGYNIQGRCYYNDQNNIKGTLEQPSQEQKNTLTDERKINVLCQ